MDSRLRALRSTESVSGSVVSTISARGMSLRPYKASVAYLRPRLAVAVDVRILLPLILRFAAVVAQTATSPVLTLMVLLPGCPALTMLLLLLLLLLLLVPGCSALARPLLLPLLGSPVSNTTSRRVTSAVHVVSGGGEIPVSA